MSLVDLINNINICQHVTQDSIVPKHPHNITGRYAAGKNQPLRISVNLCPSVGPAFHQIWREFTPESWLQLSFTLHPSSFWYYFFDRQVLLLIFPVCSTMSGGQGAELPILGNLVPDRSACALVRCMTGECCIFIWTFLFPPQILCKLFSTKHHRFYWVNYL